MFSLEAYFLALTLIATLGVLAWGVSLWRRAARFFFILIFMLMTGCAMNDLPRLQSIERSIDLQRFMGDWYVIGSIPIDTWFASEANAHNAVETYALTGDGRIQTTYTFRKDGFDGEEKEFNPLKNLKFHQLLLRTILGRGSLTYGFLLAVAERGIKTREHIIAATHRGIQRLCSVSTNHGRVHHRLEIRIPRNHH